MSSDSKFTISMTDNAKAELRETLTYISVDLANPTAAEALYRQLSEVLSQLSMFPESGSRMINTYMEESDIRKIPVKNYVVFYRIHRETNIVRILSVLHGNRNVKEIIEDLIKS